MIDKGEIKEFIQKQKDRQGVVNFVYTFPEGRGRGIHQWSVQNFVFDDNCDQPTLEQLEAMCQALNLLHVFGKFPNDLILASLN